MRERSFPVAGTHVLLTGICIAVVLVLLPDGGSVHAQQFTKITSGPHVNDSSASRSVNWVDYNGDGYLDLFVTTGPNPGTNNLLYHNEGPPNYEFLQITASDITSDLARSDGSSWADYDNDGDPDAFVVNWYNENNMMFTNNGGTFNRVLTGVQVNDRGYSETCSWGDYDNDGYVDLYVSNSEGTTLKNFFYRNAGETSFTRITTGAPATDLEVSRGVNWVDFDNDGDEDLFVANEANMHNSLYRNMLKESGGARFEKVTGTSLVSDGGASWSGSWGDYDNDGDQDVFIANWGNQVNFLYKNNGDRTFTRILGDPIVSEQSWSASSAWGDFDNDGDLDMFVTNAYGGVSKKLNFLYINKLMETDTARFEKVTTGDIATDQGWSYGTAWGDYDRDGDLDLMAARTFNDNENNTLYRNENANGNHWLGVRAVGNLTNRSGIGTKVRIKATIGGSPVWQRRELAAQSGYCGQNMEEHFGLGDAAVIDTIIIEWLSGRREIQTNVPVDQLLTFNESNSTAMYLLAVQATTGGSITAPATSPVPVEHGVATTITAVAATGFHFVNWTVAAGSAAIADPNILSTAATLTSGNATVRANFAIDTHTISSSAGPQGAIVPAGELTINHGDSRRYTFVPATGYQVDSVIVDGTPVDSLAGYTFANVTASHTIHVVFAVGMFTLTATAGANGSIIPSGIVVQEYGGSQLFTFEPTADFEIDSLLIDNVPVAIASSYTFTNITSNHTIRATFRWIFINCDVSVSAGWNLLSVPLIVGDFSREAVFATAVSKAYGYGGTYAPAPVLSAGKGYWLKFNGEEDLTLTGRQRLADSVEVMEGWNLIGGLSSSLAAAVVTSDPPGMTTSKFFAYEGRYVQTDTLKAGKGYWVKTSRAGKLVLSPAALSAAAAGRRIRIVPSHEMPPALPDAGTGAGEAPKEYGLAQNYPNPFNPTTELQFSISTEHLVTVKVFNVLGEEVATLVNEVKEPGTHNIQWDARGVPSGVYVAKLVSGSSIDSKRMLLIR